MESEPVGGMDMIARAFERRVGKTVTYNTEVTRLVNLADRVEVHVKNTVSGKAAVIEGDFCLCTVTVGGKVVASSNHALTLQEARYPPVQYVRRDDVDMTQFTPTDQTTYCPYKGTCVYFSIPGGGAKSVNAIWSYQDPHDAVAVIKNYLAFYPDQVDSIEIKG